MADLFSRLKQISPETPDNEIIEGVSKIKAAKPQITDDEIVSTTEQAKQNEMNNVNSENNRAALRTALVNKYGLDKRQQLVDQNEQDSSGYNTRAAIAGIGSAIRRKGAEGTDAVLNQDKQKRDERLNQFDKNRSHTLQNYEFEKSFENDERNDAQIKLEEDVASDESKLADSLARRMGYKGQPLTAKQFKEQGSYFSKMYDIEQKALDRKEARDERRFQAGLKEDEKLQALKTPYGIANTVDDAKQLKEAHEAKNNFDSKLQDMIDLRKKYGAETFNREAVARGKQLSKDLLLEYKNMVKLGVLSKADEDIINAIIPADPLDFQVSSLIGQDPILHKLESFKKDSDKDFQTRIQTRTRKGIENYNSESPRQNKENKPSEVERKTKDGRIAIFDSNSKEFLRYK